jgi:putative component of toxin-antitoxin plasmid stabilization module
MRGAELQQPPDLFGECGDLGIIVRIDPSGGGERVREGEAQRLVWRRIDVIAWRGRSGDCRVSRCDVRELLRNAGIGKTLFHVHGSFWVSWLSGSMARRRCSSALRTRDPEHMEPVRSPLLIVASKNPKKSLTNADERQPMSERYKAR